MSNTFEDLKHNIKFYRTLLKLSQQELAEKSGISTSYIADIELGRRTPSLKTLIKLADTFNIKSYLLLKNPETDSSEAVNDFSKLLINRIQEDIDDLKSHF